MMPSIHSSFWRDPIRSFARQVNIDPVIVMIALIVIYIPGASATTQ